ncbi:MAG TPA: hypothetical protein VMI31_18275 [Fimbriimonadaceae bacterium]|nr:hypothetical protein [Fimbriimonadaceae bacterium]
MRIGLGLFGVVIATALALSLAGCGGGGSGPNLPDPIIRFANVSPDANPLDYYLDYGSTNQVKEATGLAYLGSSSNITIHKFDTSSGNNLSVVDPTQPSLGQLDSVSFTFARNNYYLCVNVGLENYGSEFAKRLQLLTFQYDHTAPNGNKANLLIVHGYMEAPGLDTPNIDFQGGPVGSYDPNNPQFSSTNISFADANPPTLQVDAGVSLIFQARWAGLENVLASDPGTTFDAGGIYLALVSGVEGQSGAEAPKVTYIKLN